VAIRTTGKTSSSNQLQRPQPIPLKVRLRRPKLPLRAVSHKLNLANSISSSRNNMVTKAKEDAAVDASASRRTRNLRYSGHHVMARACSRSHQKASDFFAPAKTDSNNTRAMFSSLPSTSGT